MGTATGFDEILLQFFWIDPRATRVELFEGARQKKGQEFRKSGPVTIFSQPQRRNIMVSDICLAIIALMLTILVAFLLLFIIKMKERVEILQEDLQRLTERTANLMDHLDGLLVSSGHSSEEENRAIPRWLKWIASSALLIKTTREYIKSHGKAQQ